MRAWHTDLEVLKRLHRIKRSRLYSYCVNSLCAPWNGVLVFMPGSAHGKGWKEAFETSRDATISSESGGALSGRDVPLIEGREPPEYRILAWLLMPPAGATCSVLVVYTDPSPGSPASTGSAAPAAPGYLNAYHYYLNPDAKELAEEVVSNLDISGIISTSMRLKVKHVAILEEQGGANLAMECPAVQDYVAAGTVRRLVAQCAVDDSFPLTSASFLGLPDSQWGEVVVTAHEFSSVERYSRLISEGRPPVAPGHLRNGKTRRRTDSEAGSGGGGGGGGGGTTGSGRISTYSSETATMRFPAFSGISWAQDVKPWIRMEKLPVEKELTPRITGMSESTVRYLLQRCVDPFLCGTPLLFDLESLQVSPPRWATAVLESERVSKIHREDRARSRRIGGGAEDREAARQRIEATRVPVLVAVLHSRARRKGTEHREAWYALLRFHGRWYLYHTSDSTAEAEDLVGTTLRSLGLYGVERVEVDVSPRAPHRSSPSSSPPKTNPRTESTFEPNAEAASSQMQLIMCLETVLRLSLGGKPPSSACLVARLGGGDPDRASNLRALLRRNVTDTLLWDHQRIESSARGEIHVYASAQETIAFEQRGGLASDASVLEHMSDFPEQALHLLEKYRGRIQGNRKTPEPQAKRAPSPPELRTSGKTYSQAASSAAATTARATAAAASRIVGSGIHHAPGVDLMIGDLARMTIATPESDAMFDDKRRLYAEEVLTGAIPKSSGQEVSDAARAMRELVGKAYSLDAMMDKMPEALKNVLETSRGVCISVSIRRALDSGGTIVVGGRKEGFAVVSPEHHNAYYRPDGRWYPRSAWLPGALESHDPMALFSRLLGSDSAVSFPLTDSYGPRSGSPASSSSPSSSPSPPSGSPSRRVVSIPEETWRARLPSVQVSVPFPEDSPRPSAFGVPLSVSRRDRYVTQARRWYPLSRSPMASAKRNWKLAFCETPPQAWKKVEEAFGSLGDDVASAIALLENEVPHRASMLRSSPEPRPREGVLSSRAVGTAPRDALIVSPGGALAYGREYLKRAVRDVDANRGEGGCSATIAMFPLIFANYVTRSSSDSSPGRDASSPRPILAGWTATSAEDAAVFSALELQRTLREMQESGAVKRAAEAGDVGPNGMVSILRSGLIPTSSSASRPSARLSFLEHFHLSSREEAWVFGMEGVDREIWRAAIVYLGYLHVIRSETSRERRSEHVRSLMNSLRPTAAYVRDHPVEPHLTYYASLWKLAITLGI